jgi:hypothetical protein
VYWIGAFEETRSPEGTAGFSSPVSPGSCSKKLKSRVFVSISSGRGTAAIVFRRCLEERELETRAPAIRQRNAATARIDSFGWLRIAEPIPEAKRGIRTAPLPASVLQTTLTRRGALRKRGTWFLTIGLNGEEAGSWGTARSCAGSVSAPSGQWKGRAAGNGMTFFC